MSDEAKNCATDCTQNGNGFKTSVARRPLTERMLTCMNLGKRFWCAKLSLVQDEDARAAMERYAKDISEQIKLGYGMMFWGDSGVGKTSCAALLAKEAARWGYSVYVTTWAELKEDILNKIMYDDNTSVYERIKVVDMFVLDDLPIEASTDNILGVQKLCALLGIRANKMKSIIITTRMNSDDIKKSFKSLYDVLRDSILPIGITGKNLREDKNNV